MAHRTVSLPGVHMHVVDEGSGMPVVMCHGFPGLSYSYRRQMRPVADAGFRALAPDMLGYGATDAPREPRAYTHERIAADLLALLDEVAAPRAVFVGHDFGAPAVWQVALRAPERVAGLVLLSVPYDPEPSPVLPSRAFAHVARQHFLHLHYFQQPGVADAELAANPREFLHRLFFALSGSYRYLDIWRFPSEGHGYLDVLPAAPPLPWPWLSGEEFDHYVDVFTRTGFSGGLNWYRALDANWVDDAPYARRPITVPTMLIAGSRDPVLAMSGQDALERMRAAVPDLRGVHLLDGAGHWIQQERADDVNRLLTDFLQHHVR